MKFQRINHEALASLDALSSLATNLQNVCCGGGSHSLDLKWRTEPANFRQGLSFDV
jgi:hypothetical protein